MNAIIKNVPTNIVTGFLGTGKTSTIQHLLKNKPEHERWAILVNEFGSVGIDGTLYQNKHKEEGGIFVRTVPGGCMCCVSGLPMQIALNVLLKLSNPHRLFIEPSGLGHPVEVVALLKSKYYKDVLDIQKIITLIDPQQFVQTQYSEHPTYQQQLQIADVVVVNKTDVCTDRQLDEFNQEYKKHNHNSKDVFYCEFGQINTDLLDGATDFKVQDGVIIRASDEPLSEDLLPEPPITSDSGFIKSSRSGEGFKGISWRYHKDFTFDMDKLLKWLKEIQAERIKGVVKTDQGIVGLNMQPGQIEVVEFDDCDESKIEVITNTPDKSWDTGLAECIVKLKINSKVKKYG